MVFNKLSKS